MTKIKGAPIGLLLTLTHAESDGDSGGETPTPQVSPYWTKQARTITTWTKQ